MRKRVSCISVAFNFANGCPAVGLLCWNALIKRFVGVSSSSERSFSPKEKQIKSAIKKAMIKKFTKIKRKVNNG